jgi:hypothetical protein
MHPPHPVEPRAHISLADSGYHGSQSQDTVNYDHFDKDIDMADSPQQGAEEVDLVFSPPGAPVQQSSPSVASAKTFQSPNQGQTRQITAYATASVAATPSSAIVQPSSPFASRTRLPIMSPRSPSPQKMSSPTKHSPHKSRPASPPKSFSNPTETLQEAGDRNADDVDNGSDGELSDASSPIRTIVRKSSLNFASLPAREPMASKKSIGGARMSRTSHLDFSRPSYFNRHTGGKSLGTTFRPESEDEDDQDEMDVDEIPIERENGDSRTATHSKTETQRLQDQISMLGKPQPTGPRPSKSLANFLPPQQSAPASRNQSQPEPVLHAKPLPSKPKESVAAPGAFPDDDTDDWIAPPNNIDTSVPASPKHTPQNLYAVDLTGDLAGKAIVGSSEFVLPKSRPTSPAKTPFSPSRPANAMSHGKSVSVPTLPTLAQLNLGLEDLALKKTISVSNPALTSVAEDDFTFSPPKSPTRSFKESPLNKLRNKVSSIFKGSKGLMVSSAAISAEGKFSLLQSPSTTRLGYHPQPSVESFKTTDSVVYPDLSQQVSAVTAAPLSPVRTNSTRKTRNSADREKLEMKERERQNKEREKEMKEANRVAEKLEKMRQKESEKARVFSKEQEKIAAMERQVAAQKEQEQVAQTQVQPPAQDFRTPGPRPKSALRSPIKTNRTNPRKTKGQAEEEGKNNAAHSGELDLDMADAPSMIPPQSIPRPTTASSMRTQGIKRPMKPTKETVAKSKQAPTVIRVNTNSSQQQPPFHPSNSVVGGTLQDTLGQQHAPAKQLNGKPSHGSLNGKPSNFTISGSSSARPKALEAAAKKREQEERETQQKRDIKQEQQRKRAAQEEERKRAAQEEEARKAAQAKRAAIEKAKHTKAPPPAVRPQPNAPPEYSTAERTIRPPSRLGSTMQDNRLVHTALPNTAKGPSKRPLQPDAGEEGSRSQQQRALPLYQSKETKRMRVSEEFDDDMDMMDSHNQGTIKKAPVRPSGGLKKVSGPKPMGRLQNANSDTQDPPTKSMYGNGYANAPPPSARGGDLFKTTVIAQHHGQAKTGHPLDMAQLSKGVIPFAPNDNPAHKTPARPAGGAMPKSAKSANRSSPRFQNGETIELPDIQTDDDSDDDDDDGHMTVAAWADSPALKAALLAQERVDPMQVFGPPAPLNMEEVFNKTKDRWHKFRARTSSANWSGTDRLTDEDVRKDLVARDKMRREGGWSYEMSREMS